MNATIDTRLDQLEDRLPALPASVLHLQRAIAITTYRSARATTSAVIDSLNDIADVAEHGRRTVAGTTVWVVKQNLSTARTGFRQITGQVGAQAKRTAEAINDEALQLSEDMTDRAETHAAVALNSMTKEELYSEAQASNIEGRASMSKGELVDALAAS